MRKGYTVYTLNRCVDLRRDLANVSICVVVGGLVGIYMWHGWYLEFRGPSVGMQDKTDALSRLCALRLMHCFGVSQC